MHPIDQRVQNEALTHWLNLIDNKLHTLQLLIRRQVGLDSKCTLGRLTSSQEAVKIWLLGAHQWCKMSNRCSLELWDLLNYSKNLFRGFLLSAMAPFVVAAKIDALSIVYLFTECLGNATNCAPTSPKSIGHIANRSIGCSILAILGPQDSRSNVESQWHWQLCSSATVRLSGKRPTLRPHFWSDWREFEKFWILRERAVI